MQSDRKKKGEFTGKDVGRLVFNAKSEMNVCDWKNSGQQIFTRLVR